MIKYHPNDSMLLEYAAGIHNWALSLSIATHLQMCTQCRQKAYDLNNIGGALLESVPEEEPSSEAFRRLMSKIDQTDDSCLGRLTRKAAIIETENDATTEPDSQNIPGPCTDDLLSVQLPKVLRKLLPRDGPLPWKKVTPSLRVARVTIRQSSDKVAFYRIARGAKAVKHRHRGPQVTLVLSGNFSDAEDLYSPGDFLVKQAGEVHRPTATQDQACFYLSVMQAPATCSLLGRLGHSLRFFKGT